MLGKPLLPNLKSEISELLNLKISKFMSKLITWFLNHRKGIRIALQTLANIVAAIATALATTSCMGWMDV